VKVAVYPADQWGCGSHRLIWPARELQRRGYDVTIVSSQNRHVEMVIDNRTDTVAEVKLPDDIDVVVFQRVTHRYLSQAVEAIRRTGRTVVIDIDDDLSSIHPSNPAWEHLHPRANERRVGKPSQFMHSWGNLGHACRNASLVVTTTAALATKYGHGHAAVIPNYLADHYYDVEHEDTDLIGWPASLTSHPNDPTVVGNAIARLVDEGHRFAVTSVATGVGRAFGLPDDDRVERATGVIALHDWPTELAKIGIGIAPLADTKFNAAKSWLKPLELAAVGVPWVGSPRADYARLHRLGCGVLVDKPKDWYRVLRRLLTDETRRAELSSAGRSVAATLRLRDHAHEWWGARAEAYDRDQASQRQPA
jgi:putative intracellular protease/amidase